jgi:hypothetical protein
MSPEGGTARSPAARRAGWSGWVAVLLLATATSVATARADEPAEIAERHLARLVTSAGMLIVVSGVIVGGRRLTQRVQAGQLDGRTAAWALARRAAALVGLGLLVLPVGSAYERWAYPEAIPLFEGPNILIALIAGFMTIASGAVLTIAFVARLLQGRRPDDAPPPLAVVRRPSRR